MKDWMQLPTELEEIRVVYRKTPTDKAIDLVSYINEIING